MASRWRFCIWVTAIGVSSLAAIAQKAGGDDFPDISQRAASAFSKSQFADAVTLYRQAVKVRPDWAEGWGYLAASLYNLQRYEEAREAYRRTTVLTPQNGPSWVYMGFCEYELRQYRAAFDHLEKAEQMGIGDTGDLALRSHYELALLWDTAGQFEMASKEISYLASMGDRSPPILEATGLVVLRMPEFPYEIPSAKHDLVMKAGEAGWAVNAHHMEDARRLYQALVAAYPREPNLHYAYGMVLTVSDQEAAVAELEKELEITPKHLQALIEASFLLLEMGKLDQSEPLARRALAVDSKNYAPHNLLGRILVQTGHEEAGIRELETAVKLAPGIAAAHLNLAQAYQKAGKGAAAEREFAAFKAMDEKKEGANGGGNQHP